MNIKITNPLEQMVLDALKQNGFDKLRDEDQKAYFPQFMAEAERRLGIALAPHLKEDVSDEFKALLNKDSSADEWFAFWDKNVPNFVDLVKETMANFAKEVSNAFKS